MLACSAHGGREEPGPRAVAAAFLVAAALILFQVSFTRLVSYKLFYHFVFLAIWLTLLGLAAAGTFVAVTKTPADPDRRVHRWLALLAASVPVAFLWMANPLGVTHHPPLLIKLVGGDAIAYLFWCAPAMVWLTFCGGVVLTALFSRYSHRMGRLYAADLLGAGAGSLACLGLMKFGSPPLAFVAGLVPVVAALLPYQRTLSRGDGQRLTAAGGLGVGLGLAAVVLFGPVRYSNFENFRREGGTQPIIVKYEWNHLIRTDHVGQSYLLDGQASTRIERWDPKSRELPVVEPAFVLAPERPTVAIIGVGGGRQLAEALRADASSVFAIDINPTILDWVRGIDVDLSHGIFHDPRVETRVAEGRHAVRSSELRFDVVMMHAIDTYAAAAIGAYSLTENFLYTVEAFEDYWGALSEDGVLTVARWLFQPARENLRLFATALAAFEKLGVEDPLAHVVMIAPMPSYAELGEARVWGRLLVSKRPLGLEDLEALRAHLDRLGWSLLYAPDERTQTAFDELARARDRAAFQRDYPYLISAVTDASPYLFQFTNPLHRSAYRERGDWVNTHLYQASSLVLLATLGLSATLGGLLILAPLAWTRRRVPEPPSFGWREGLYFAGLGVGYMAPEVPIIQILSLYLGHPTYGFAVVLVALLVSSGVGSLWVERLELPCSRACALVAVAVVVATAGALPWVHATLAWPAWARFASALLLVSAVGVPMGFPLALGVRQVGSDDARNVAWAWGTNGAASVVGSCAVMMAMVFVGSGAALLGSVVCYALAALAGLRLSGAASRATHLPS